MAVVAKSLQPGITLTSTATSVFTAGSGTYVVTSGVLSNPTADAASFTIQVQRAGGSAFDMVPARSIQANGTDLLPELSGLVLTNGDALLAFGSGLVCILSGYALS